jgi:hypothetical protein
MAIQEVNSLSIAIEDDCNDVKSRQHLIKIQDKQLEILRKEHDDLSIITKQKKEINEKINNNATMYNEIIASYSATDSKILNKYLGKRKRDDTDNSEEKLKKIDCIIQENDTIKKQFNKLRNFIKRHKYDIIRNTYKFNPIINESRKRPIYDLIEIETKNQDALEKNYNIYENKINRLCDCIDNYKNEIRNVIDALNISLNEFSEYT